MTDCAAGELGVILLDDERQPLTQVRCWVCDQLIPDPLVRQVTNRDLGAIEMCANPQCVGYIRYFRTRQDRLALQLGLIV